MNPAARRDFSTAAVDINNKDVVGEMRRQMQMSCDTPCEPCAAGIK
jgi:hypothetical protein